jgi:hypothetical protein
MKDKFIIAFVFAFIGALVGGKVTQSAFSLETTDWAARGQSVVERQKDKFIHSIPGIIIGGLGGFVLGFVIPQSIWDKAVKKMPSKELKGFRKIYILVAVLIACPVLFYIKNGYLQVLLLSLISIPVLYMFGTDIKDSDK